MGRFPRISDMEVPVDAHGNRCCRECGALVPKGRRAYCSEVCMRKFVRERTWSLVRKDVLRDARYRCAICDRRYRKSELDVDHIIPIQMGGEPFSRANLRPLCRPCHRAKTGLDRDALRLD